MFMTIITPKLLKKPSSILSATLSRFLAATLFALLFVAQPSNAQGVDASQPTIAFTNPSQLVNDAAFTLTGTVTAGATVNVLADSSGMEATVIGMAWSLDVTLIEGNNVFTVIATDAAGNTSTANIVITLNSLLAEAPVITAINTVLNNANEQGVICITFDGDVKFDGSPNAAFLNARPGDFVVSSDTSPAPTVIEFTGHCSVDFVTRNNAIQLTLNRQIAFGEMVTLSYTKTGTEHDTKGIRRDVAGGSEPLADFSDKLITNNAIKPIEGLELQAAGTFSAANQIFLSFGLEIVTASPDLRAADFTVSGAASSPAVTGISSLSPSALLLTLDANIVGGEAITLSYTKTMGSISNASAEELVNFTDYSVANTRPAPAPVTAPSISISTATVTATVGNAIADITITSSGGAVTSYGIAPTLPEGLTLDITTGTISGTPTAVSASTNYTITATNSSGLDTVTLTIVVNAAPGTTAAAKPVINVPVSGTEVNTDFVMLTGTASPGANVLPSLIVTPEGPSSRGTAYPNLITTAGSDGVWTIRFYLDIGFGEYTIVVTATAGSGDSTILKSSEPITITRVRDTSHGATITTAAQTVNTASFTLTGTANGPSFVQLFRGAATTAIGNDNVLTAGGAWTITVMLEEGANVFTATATDGSGKSAASAAVIITLNTANANAAPTANAGPDQIIGSGSAVRGSQDDSTPGAADAPDQTVTEMSRITLDGTGSSDPDGTIDSYKWTLVSGTHFELKGFAENDASTTFFTPPTSSAGATLVFSLVVTDDDGAESTPDEVVIRVTSHNVQPIANAGDDQSVDENTLVTLDGTGSSDPDFHTLSYSWTLTEFPTLDSSPEIPQLSDPTVASPTFTAPEVVGGISLVYTLTVTDNAEAPKSHTDTVRININNVAGGMSAADDDGAITGASDEVGMHSSPQNTPNKSASLLKVFNGSQYVDFVGGVTIQTGVPKFKGTSSGISSVQVLLNDVQVGGNNISSDGTFRKGWKHTPLADGTYTISINNNKGGRELFSSSIIIDKDSDGNPSVSATINKVDAALSPFDLTVMLGKTAAIGDELSVKDISISPNPTSGILNITVNEKAYYKLLNIRGQTLKTGVLSTGKSKIDISSFAKGIYLLNIKTSKRSFTGKVIKD